VNCGEFEGINTYFNIRNVNRATDDEFIENVFRNETAYRADEQLLTKFLFIYHSRDKTPEGKDQDTITGSAAFKYDFSESLSLEETVERTNEYPGFPDGLYAWLTMNPAPPYPFYNISKTCFLITPAEWIEIALEYVYNEFQSAATVDDFMNYAGTDVLFWFTDNLSARGVYRYSRVEDYHRAYKKIGHHNVYFDIIYDVNENASLTVEFGKLGSYIEGLGWQSAVLDTQHIIKVIYEGRF